MAQHISDEEREMIKCAAEKLGEHFDSVQIFVSRHNDNKTGTSRFQTGVGNWFARYGHIHHWLMLQNEEDRQDLRDDMKEE